MKDEAKPAEADETLTIPAGHFVHHADFDADEPYVLSTSSGEAIGRDVRHKVPKALAYYLRTHFCGSKKYHESVEQNARRELQISLQDLLGLNEEDK